MADTKEIIPEIQKKITQNFGNCVANISGAERAFEDKYCLF